ncbi:MAG: zinc-ribbon domain-containing protein [Desulfovibrio sp.]|jgi:predicted Zn finger-like uncharacterized protein|nr:zinc-ribbon domain-containing protein [Desulfovibrio sp.]
MEIQCPKCASRFNLPEDLARDGAKLRCSVCKTVFPCSVPDAKALEQPSDPAKKVRDKKKYGRKTALAALLLALCLAGGLLGYFWYGRQNPATPPMEDIAQKVAELTMRNVRQYYVDNEKIGKVMVIEGKVVNGSSRPKALIAVEAAIYDKDRNTLSVKKQMAGTQLSLFQLQVLSEKEMESFLNNKIEILSNNINVPRDEEVPFMALFYDPPSGVAEFGVRIVDAQDADASGK